MLGFIAVICLQLPNMPLKFVQLGALKKGEVVQEFPANAPNKLVALCVSTLKLVMPQFANAYFQLVTCELSVNG